MRTAAQIRREIENKHAALVKMRHAKNKGGLAFECAIAEVQGHVAALEWVLGKLSPTALNRKELQGLKAFKASAREVFDDYRGGRAEE